RGERRAGVVGDVVVEVELMHPVDREEQDVLGRGGRGGARGQGLKAGGEKTGGGDGAEQPRPAAGGRD
ncbi:MAG: hypothetical protein QOE44_1097, partial [Solirubrobacteraceae bacterium]|nr:hypothetical protein [Solirubrobacteraceae bacterium]